MPKKKRKARTWKELPTAPALLVPDDDPAESEPMAQIEEPPAPTEEDEDVDDVLTQLPPETVVELWRWDTKQDDWGYVARYPVQGFTVDRVAKERGPGKYRMIIRGPVEGRMRIRGRKVFVVSGPEPGTLGGGGMDLVSSGVMQLLSLQTEMMRAQLAAPKDTPAQMIAAIAQLVKPQERLTADPFKMALEIFSLLKESKSESLGIKDVLDVVERVMDMTPEGGDGLGVLGHAVAKLVDKLDLTGHAAQAQRVRDAAEARGIATEPKNLPSSPDEKILSEFIATAAVVLERAAERGADPAFYAEWVAEQFDGLPDAVSPHIEDWLQNPAFPDILLPLFPRVEPNWLRSVLSQARALLMEEGDEYADTSGDDSDSMDSVGGRRNMDNAAGDGETGQRSSP